MNLWLSSHFLVAGLFLSSSALTPEECQPLITPVSLFDPSMMFGRSNFIMGYTDNEFYNNFLKNIESYWTYVTPSAFSPKTLIIATENKINGSCLSLNMNGTVDDDALSMTFDNFSAVYHLLPSCDGCLLYSFNRTVRNVDRMYSKMKLNGDAPAEEIRYRGLYLLARETTVKDSDLEHFKKQASCLGFNREADFIYDPKNDFCAEGGGLNMTED